MQAVPKIILLIFLFYCIYCVLIFFRQRHLIFLVRFIDTPTSVPPKTAFKYETDWLDMDFGKAETWFLAAYGNEAAGPRPAIIFAHGNAELIDFGPEEFLPFAISGIGVLLVEYPGYGRSSGRPSAESITETFVAAYDKLVKRDDVDPSAIILFGRSMGGGAVCRLAAERPSSALVLASTFTGLRAFAKKYLAPKFLIRDNFDNYTAVSNYKEPVLVIHGKSDDLIPYSHGKRLDEAAEKSSFISYDCGHNDCPPDPVKLHDDVMAFLRKARIILKENGNKINEKNTSP